MSNSHMHRTFINCRNFSLVELLVAISIIAILASLLLPTLNKARAKGHAINCISNLKQCGGAFASYAVDSDDRLPPHFGSSSGQPLWTDVLLGRISGSGPVENRYLTREMLRCPSQEGKLSSGWWVWTPHYGTNYGVFAVGSGVAGDMEHGSRKLNTQRFPSRKIAVADSWKVTNGHPDETSGFWRIAPSLGVYNDQFGSPAARHSSIANVLWLDWHVSPVKVRVPQMPHETSPEFNINTEIGKMTLGWGIF